MNKKEKNKGFSLVELIIVIAIMAVLVGILAPTYFKYIEKSRITKAVTNTKCVVDAITVVLTDTQVDRNDAYDELVKKISEGNGTSTNPATVYLAEDDPFGCLILHELNSDEPITGEILFYFNDSDTIEFQLIMDQSMYIVDYNRTDENVTYAWEDTTYHVRRKN